MRKEIVIVLGYFLTIAPVLPQNWQASIDAGLGRTIKITGWDELNGNAPLRVGASIAYRKNNYWYLFYTGIFSGNKQISSSVFTIIPVQAGVQKFWYSWLYGALRLGTAYGNKDKYSGAALSGGADIHFVRSKGSLRATLSFQLDFYFFPSMSTNTAGVLPASQNGFIFLPGIQAGITGFF